ncbi:MAG: C25 family cysteine peptidase [Candidatus Eisenbacteria bacterium]
MRPASRFLALCAALLALTPAIGRADEGFRVLASDAGGVTLRLQVPQWSLSPADADGRVSIVGVPGSHSLAEPGRALVPVYSGLIAIPAGVRPVLRVLESAPEEASNGVRLRIAERPVFRDAGDGQGAQPGMATVEPLRDGPWPLALSNLGAPFAFRGRRLAAVEVRPFHYDESAARLTVARTVTVRIDFIRSGSTPFLPSGGEDRHVDPVLAGKVLNWDQARAWRTGNAPLVEPTRRAGTARLGGVPALEPEVRVRCDSTALYYLPYSELVAKGYPSGIPIAQVSMHRREYIEGGDPPFVTIALPCEVMDVDGNGVFGPGDGIWVYVRTWASRSGASNLQRLWGDAEVVYASRNRAGGLRVASRRGWRDAVGLTNQASYPNKVRFEKNFAAMMPFVGLPTDTNVSLFHWTEIASYYERPDTLRFDVNDIDTTHTVEFAVNWVGRRFSSHFLWAAVRNNAGQVTSVADSVFWSNKYPFTASSSLRGSALSEGRTNSLRFWGKSFASPPDPISNNVVNVGLDWFDVTYWRSFTAIRSYLEFNSGAAAGLTQIRASGFLAESLRVYDVTNPEGPVRLLIDPAQISGGGSLAFTMQDSINPGERRSYVAAAVDNQDPSFGARVPPSANFTAVAQRNLYGASSGDYLIVVPDAFLAAVQPLVDMRTAEGLRVLVAPLESIQDEFNGGRHSAAAIQRFARFAYQKWDARFLLLVGDGSLDPQNFRRTSGGDWVPVLPSPGPVPVGEGYEVIPSDNRYACLTGNCDPIFGGIVVPEMMVGRLPVNSLGETQTMVAKLVGYEDLSGDVSWRRRVLLHADDAYSGETTFGGGSTGSTYCRRAYEERFRTLNEKIGSIITRDAGLSLMQVELFNQRYYEAGEPFIYAPPADTCRPDRAATQTRTHANITPILFSKLNPGVLWWNYQGHANEFVLSHEDIYRNAGTTPGGDDRFLFTNDNRPNLFSAFSCHANMFARPEHQLSSQGPALGEDIVLLAGGKGSIASWASVCYEVVPRDDSSHVNVELARNLFADPPRDAFLTERGSRVVLGEAILATFLSYLPTVANYGYERGIAISYTLLGDPATRMSIGKPQTIVTLNTATVADGQPVRLHALSNDILLIADLVSTVRLDSLGLYEITSSGTVPIPDSAYTLTPTFPDTTTGSSVYGGRRYRLTYTAPLRAETYRYVLRTRDRDGLESQFTVLLQLDGVLRVNDVAINDDDDISATASLSLLLLTPRPVNPNTELSLKVNGVAQAFTSQPAPGDASGREWILRWNHAPYPVGDYVVTLEIAGGGTITRRFRVTTAAGEVKLSNLIAFPNPFGNEGTYFSFQLLGSDAADVRISIFTVSGKVIRSDVVRSLMPGYHQLPWDAKDAEGSEIGNGVYLYRLTAVTLGGAKVEQTGQLVKLRRPRRIEEPVTP